MIRTFLITISRALLLPFKVGFEKEGSEGDEGADEDKSGSFDGPLSFPHGEIEKDEEDCENDTMDHSGNTDGSLVAKDSLFVNCEVEKDDERESIEEREETEESE